MNIRLNFQSFSKTSCTGTVIMKFVKYLKMKTNPTRNELSNQLLSLNNKIYNLKLPQIKKSKAYLKTIYNYYCTKIYEETNMLYNSIGRLKNYPEDLLIEQCIYLK